MPAGNVGNDEVADVMLLPLSSKVRCMLVGVCHAPAIHFLGANAPHETLPWRSSCFCLGLVAKMHARLNFTAEVDAREYRSIRLAEPGQTPVPDNALGWDGHLEIGVLKPLLEVGLEGIVGK